MSEKNAPLETMWQGKYIVAHKKGTWEFVSRPNHMQAAVILAMDTDYVLLVEQFRMPLGRNCLELPAGLIGDHGECEEPAVAALRELEEETGWTAHVMTDMGEFYSSPGMVSKSFHLFRASQLEEIGDGGGVDGENITVHRVKRADISAFIAQKRAENCAIDVKLLMLLAGDIMA